MATKRVSIRRQRRGGEAEFRAWIGTFTWGADYLNDLEPFGITDPVGRVVPVAHEPAARAAFRDATAAAWQRFGARFMAEWTPTARQPLPWAAQQFGAPHGN